VRCYVAKSTNESFYPTDTDSKNYKYCGLAQEQKTRAMRTRRKQGMDTYRKYIFKKIR